MLAVHYDEIQKKKWLPHDLRIQGRCATPSEDGVLYIVTGGGGHSTLHEDECGPGCPWSRFRASVHHFVNVVVEGNTLRGQAIKIDGTVIDNFTVLKE